MRYATFGLFLALAACGGQSIQPPPEPREQPTSYDVDLVVDPSIYERVKTHELGTERVRPIAKTIEWADIGTREGTRYVAGTVAVDRILREDSDNSYGVRVRLKNRSAKVLSLEYLVHFHTRAGSRLAAYHGGIGNAERWKPFVLDPHGLETVSDFCRIIGAEGFTLFVRRAGAKSEGKPEEAAPEEPK